MTLGIEILALAICVFDLLVLLKLIGSERASTAQKVLLTGLAIVLPLVGATIVLLLLKFDRV
jgi:hypothetical protein